MGKCYNTITVKAPIDRVWSTIRDFHDLSWAKGVVDSVERVGDKSGDQIGARRILNNAFHETLQAVNELAHSFAYTIDDGPGPVSKDAVRNYVGSVKLLPVTTDDSTFVEWASRYDSADDVAVGELCNPIYRALLEALRDHFA